jgi:hypothetical protein
MPVQLTPLSDCRSREHVRGVADGNPAQNTHNACASAFAEHYYAKRVETDTAGRKKCGDDREQDDHGRRIGR